MSATGQAHGGDKSQASAADVALVIVNYRSPDLVERCCAAAQAGAAGLQLEIVIVDNASGDGSVPRLRQALPSATVIAMPTNGGFASGVNAGFRNCSAEIVVVLNPDAELRGEALRDLVSRLKERPDLAVAAPLLEGPDGRIAPNGYKRFPGLAMVAIDMCLPFGYATERAPALHPYVMSPAALLAGRTPAWVCGAAMAIRRSAYAQAGAFDERFFLYFEETEWQQRVREKGWNIEVLAGARARHLIRGGGELSLSPSPHFLTSAMRYLRLRGVPVAVSRAVIALSLATSWLTLRVISWLPGKRAKASLQARAYRELISHALSDFSSPSPSRSGSRLDD